MPAKPLLSGIPQAEQRVLFEKGRLQVQCALQRADFGAFQDGCNALMHSPSPHVVLDLTRCTYVSSLFIGVLVDAVTTMQTAGKTIDVLVSPQVGRFLHMAHLYHLFEYTIVERPEGEHA
jgi:anti-anti-sigma regulatory factor